MEDQGSENTAKKSKKQNWFGQHKVLTAILVVIVLAIIGGASGSNKQQPTRTNSSQSAPLAATTQPKTQAPSVPAEYKSALTKATEYANIMHMSKQGVYDQLVSQYGEKFSPAAAQYAIDNVKADWSANALAKAKDYQNEQQMSPAAIHDQLTSQYGEKFTQAEADYAIQHLND